MVWPQSGFLVVKVPEIPVADGVGPVIILHRTEAKILQLCQSKNFYPQHSFEVLQFLFLQIIYLAIVLSLTLSARPTR